MKKHDRFDGYTVNMFLDEDGEYLAHFVEMPNVSAFGESPESALKELATAWEGVKESYQKHDEPFPVFRPIPAFEPVQSGYMEYNI